MKLKGAEKHFWWLFAGIKDSKQIPNEIPGFTSIDSMVDDEYIAILFDRVNIAHSIYLKQTEISDEAVKSISKVKKLTSLTLMKHPKITRKSLPYLNQLTDLEYLDIWRTGVILEDLHELNQLKNLKELYVSATRQAEDGSFPEMEKDLILEKVIELEVIFPGCAIYVDFDRY
ncbi:hypothetical protein [Chryseobacterium sp.]|uniref:hypothetical protein n=1 Tax=Chryseobacterium sp. TaxID=1871047 RepID=UPI0011C72B2D|nr:hypothetical protein [Chryseobacterium sp.]TXF77226.1 hypothetical protein FUA25_04610 [Chryseobacterium sp.]